MVKNRSKPEVLNVGMRTLTDSQYAIMYLMYRNKASELMQPYRSMDDKNLRIHAGLSDQTVRHQLRRFAIIIDGQEDLILTSGDEYYEKLLQKMQDHEDIDPSELRRDMRLANKFGEMSLVKVAELANEAFTSENKEIGQYYYNKNLEQQAKYAQDKKLKENTEKTKIQQFVSDYTKSLAKTFGFSTAQDKAMRMATTKFGRTLTDVRKVVRGE